MIVLQQILRNEYLKQAHKLSLQKQNKTTKIIPKQKAQMTLNCASSVELSLTFGTREPFISTCL